MGIRASSSGHDYKVFVSVEPYKDKRDDAPSPMIKFQCNTRIKHVPNKTDASIPTNIMDHDSWTFFQLPYDMLTSDDNFSSFEPRSCFYQMLNLMKIPFKLDKLFWKQSHQDKEQVPLEINPDGIVTLILDAACAMAYDAVGVSEGKARFLLVTVEKEVTVPHGEYVGMLKAKKEELFDKIRDKVVRMLQLEEQGHKFPKPEWENMVDVIVKSGLSEAMQYYLTSLMKHSSNESTHTEQA